MKKKETLTSSLHPYYGWQLLRRNANYRKVIDDLFNKMENTDNLENEEAVDEYKDVEAEICDYEKDYTHSEYMAIMETPHLKRSLYTATEEFLELMPNPVFNPFYLVYGDVLAIPIDYEIEHPNPEILNLVWNCRPVNIFREHDIRIDKQREEDDQHYDWSERLFLNIAINMNFTNEQIINEITKILRKNLPEIRENADEFGVEKEGILNYEPLFLDVRNWDGIREKDDEDRFQSWMRAWDIISKSPRMKWIELAKSLWPEKFSRPLSEDEKTKYTFEARNRYERAKRLIGVFDREPK